MYRINDWNENEKFSLQKISQDIIRMNTNNNVKTSCCIDTTCEVETSCCIDTTKIRDPRMSFTRSSCCIDTTKE